MDTHQCLPTDRLDEGVQHLAEDFDTDARAADLGRVAVHAGLPGRALVRHRWHGVLRAEVRLVEHRALGDLLHGVHGVLCDAVLDVMLYREDELKHEVDDDGRERRVEEHLDVAAGVCMLV